MSKRSAKASSDLSIASHLIARNALMEIHRLRALKWKIYKDALRRFEERKALAMRRKLKV